LQERAGSADREIRRGGGCRGKPLILIDGRTARARRLSGVFREVRDRLLEDIEWIEILRGLALPLKFPG
jgi:hypothetical protein